MRGLEPPRGWPHWLLKPARLPIPPHAHCRVCYHKATYHKRAWLAWYTQQYMAQGSVPLLLGAAVVVVALGFAGGVLWATSKNTPPSDNERIAEFYATEVAVHKSAHSVRKAIMQGDDSFVLVDLRSPQEYEREHIVGAVNIPAYRDPDTSAYGEVERIVREFRKLQAEHPGKDIIVYCYSAACMTGRKIGAMLAQHGIFVKHLTVGWQEWRYFWNLWNHDGETPVDLTWFVASGKEPGRYEGPRLPMVGGCSAEGNDFGC